MVQLTLQEINALDQAHFVEALGSLFEGPPWIVGQTWQARPFANREQLFQALCAVMYRAESAQQVVLLQAHPDLVGRAALAGTLTPASTSEQAAAGLDTLTPHEIETFQRFNAEYRARFQFPFVICVRANKKEGILAGFAARLPHSREEEIRIALGEVAKICRFRLHDLVLPTEKEVSMDQYNYEISYGKACVPLYRVYAAPLTGVVPIPESSFTSRENTLFAAEVDVEVFGGNFIAAYTEGDNRSVVATDSMKNFILRHALDFEGATLEDFLHLLGQKFLTTYPQMERIRLTGRELAFAAAPVPQAGGFAESNVLFTRSNNDFATAQLDFARSGEQIVVTGHECGRVGMQLMKITGSSFTNFVRDDYTTLPERVDRPLYIFLDVHWKYADISDIARRYIPAEQVRDVIQVVFHEFVSESIQHLVHEMGLRLLKRFPQMAEISFAGQNRTRDPMAVSEIDPKIKVYSDPFSAYGSIKLKLARKNEG
jgi:urate oxidase